MKNKRIVSLKVLSIYFFLLPIEVLVGILLRIWEYPSWAFTAFISAIILTVLLMCTFPVYIKIDYSSNRIFLKHEAFHAGELAAANNSISLDEVVGVNLETLSKEKARANNQKRWFSKYLAFDIKFTEKKRYLYVSLFTKRQINAVIKRIKEYLKEQKI